MCGLAGLIVSGSGSDESSGTVLRRMTGTLVHRGPSDEGFWEDPDHGVYLGFRRLSIQDLSDAGHQPMASSSGRYVIVFNGEAYNFGQLRSELGSSGYCFRGHSDTEVLLASVEKWGSEGALSRLRGMFAFALWDREERTLLLARDRLGIKPLFFSLCGPALAFSSELRGLLANPGIERRGSTLAAWQFLRNLYVPAPLSIIQGVEKVMPGTAVRFQVGPGGVESREDIRYWNLPELAQLEPFPSSDSESVLEELHRLISESIRLRLIADVPVGALLSGGLDSSLVVAMMQEHSRLPIRTYTIRFDDPRFDEGPSAASVAKHLGTAHTEVELPTSRVKDLIPSLAQIVDEPMANPSFLPTLLVCQVARQEVVVALSGDGGDEVFGGYNRYIYAPKMMRAANLLPGFLNGGAASTLRLAADQPWIEGFGRRLQPRNLGAQHSFSARLARAANILGASSDLTAYQNLMAVGMCSPPMREPPARLGWADRAFSAHPGNLVDKMMLHDQLQYLPDDLLAKVDRASMQVSLEARVPLLDHEVVEFSWRLPGAWKIREGETKWPLRQLARRYLPESTLRQGKIGFTVPLNRWLRGDLAPWVRATLESPRLRSRGLFDVDRVHRLWKGFQDGRGDLALSVWAVAVLEDWCENWDVQFG